jgi:hypothetical protein
MAQCEVCGNDYDKAFSTHDTKYACIMAHYAKDYKA